MSGVDQFDSWRSKKYGQISRTSKKTWKYLLWFTVNSSIVNAWLLYKKTSTRQIQKKNYEHLNFR